MKHIKPGTEVVTETGCRYIYGGPHDIPGSSRIKAQLGSGNRAQLQCDAVKVAPVSEVSEPSRNDPRIRVEKLADIAPRKADPWYAGSTVEAINGTWHKSKREAVAVTAQRLAIHDWHQGESV